MFSLRSISTKIVGILFAFGLSACAQINPANQINWPSGCSGSTPIYNIATGLCVANGSGSGVQYNSSSTAYQFLVDSKGIVATANTTSATAVSCDGTNCTVTDTQSYAANQYVQLNANSAWSPSCLNWQLVQVSSTGLSGSSFKFPQPATCSGSVSGSGGSVQDATYFFPIQTMNQPFFNGHGTLQFQSAYVSPGATTNTFITNYTALVHPYTQAVTGNPTYTFIMTGYNDVEGCSSLATIEGWYQTLWADLHTDGNIVVQYGLPSGPLGALTCYPAVVYPQLDQWLQGQKCSPGTSLTQCWDYFVNTDSTMANFYTSQLFIASNQPHFNNAGNQLVAATTNTAMAAQGTGANYGTVQGTGYNWVNGLTNYWASGAGECFFDQSNLGSGSTGPLDMLCNTLLTSSGTTYPYSYIFYAGEGNSVYKSVHTIAGAPFSYGGGVDLYSGQGAVGFNTGTCSTSSCTAPLGAITGGPTVLLSADQTYSNTMAVGINQIGQVTGFMRMAKAYFNGLLSTAVLGTDSTGLTKAAAASDLVSLFSGTCTGSNYLGADGACHVASGSGTVTSSGSPVSGNIPKFTSSTNITSAAATDIINLFSACSGTQYLGADGACHTASGSGTVTTSGSPASGNMAKFSGSTQITNAVASDVIGLFSGCSGTQYLGADGACHTPSSGSGCMSQMQTIVGTAVSTITFSSIPATCTDLTLTISGAVSGTSAGYINLQFNGDSASHYSYAFLETTASGSSPAQSVNSLSSQTASIVGVLGFSAHATSTVVSIPNYVGTTFDKSFSAVTGGACCSSSSPYAWSLSGSGEWTATPAAVTTITLTVLGGGNFAVGTTATLRGQ